MSFGPRIAANGNGNGYGNGAEAYLGNRSACFGQLSSVAGPFRQSQSKSKSRESVSESESFSFRFHSAFAAAVVLAQIISLIKDFQRILCSLFALSQYVCRQLVFVHCPRKYILWLPAQPVCIYPFYRCIRDNSPRFLLYYILPEK